MSNAAFDPALFDPPEATERPLGVSMLASTLVHVALIAALASVRPTLSLLPNRQGVKAPIQVEIQQLVLPVPASEPEPMAVITVPEPAPAPAPALPKEPVTKVPVSAPPSTSSPPEFSVRTAPAAPNGSITVGLIYNPEQVSKATAARLVQRFPVAAVRTPKLNGAVIARYPVDAARAHQSARIAAIVTVDASGRIVDDDTILFPDDPMFREAVMSAVRSARFTLAEVDGKPIAYWVILNFFFDIDPLPGTTGR